jgi:hypothetical protein
MPRGSSLLMLMRGLYLTVSFIYSFAAVSFIKFETRLLEHFYLVSLIRIQSCRKLNGALSGLHV